MRGAVGAPGAPSLCPRPVYTARFSPLRSRISLGHVTGPDRVRHRALHATVTVPPRSRWAHVPVNAMFIYKSLTASKNGEKATWRTRSLTPDSFAFGEQSGHVSSARARSKYRAKRGEKTAPGTTRLSAPVSVRTPEGPEIRPKRAHLPRGGHTGCPYGVRARALLRSVTKLGHTSGAVPCLHACSARVRLRTAAGRAAMLRRGGS